ncbi:uncharacterized mitochondrial protein AtMg00860-like [Nymphaea colorata]|uniref:uncharacterized mitochondrial protein AtMg00860-like n=1 Tax=Nymphaea colorata TaxID=210225 RepID=UPI00129DAECE|nr:uncharacterized mitochondrial protein AtMg00860-like [Nymphaea colorata]
MRFRGLGEEKLTLAEAPKKEKADHIQHLRAVLNILQQNQLHTKPSKYSLGMREISYLGHMISQGRVSMEREKVQAIKEWRTSQSVRELHAFLGLTGYYRKFVYGYITVTATLTELTKKGKFVWTEKADQSFQRLKQAVTTVLVLQLPNFQQPFTVESDASDLGMGTVLSQNSHPIAYFSKAMRGRELIAIVPQSSSGSIFSWDSDSWC